MSYRSSGSLPALVAISVILIGVYVVLTMLQIPAGTMIDWITGIVAFWWLTGITTLPWNMYFTAKDLLDDAEISQKKGITVDQEDISYAQKKAKLFLRIAIALHVVSAAALYLLAFFGISSIGYFAAIIAVVLTFVRPSYRLYDYIIARLQNMQRKILYPREDVQELRTDILVEKKRIDELVALLNLKEEDSWAAQTIRELRKTTAQSKKLEQDLEQLIVANDKAHADLSTKTQQEISKLSEDAQFLNQAREVIKFFKNA
ncbi:hypothetical protein [Cytophaga aurantiaca]|uniref:hypothetical protein n=1 Tax=Cytophaga aurantiaca TaxID=29530 RepID=UPI000361E856|nr:hypothetical protein [Cytophaga aurantiaca]